MLIAACIILFIGKSPFSALSALWSGATGIGAGSGNAKSLSYGVFHINLRLLAGSLSKTTPLLLCGVAVALALRAGLFNIGASGQMLAGALAAACVGLLKGIPFVIHLPLCLLAGILAGGGWGAIAGALKAWRGVHEVITTIMLNMIADGWVLYLVSHNLKSTTSQSIKTAQIATSAQLPKLIPQTNLSYGLLVAIIASFAIWFLLSRTMLGYRLRAVGANIDAAKANGVPVEATLTWTMFVSGGLAGLAGAIEVCGIHHCFTNGVAANYGFDGIAVALLGGLTALGAIGGALFFGMLQNGATQMEMNAQISAPIAQVIQAIVVLFIGVRYVKLPFPKPKSTATNLSPKGGTNNAS